MLNPDILVRSYRPHDAPATLDVCDKAIRVTAAQFYDQTQIHASRAARPAFERFGFVVDAENPQNMVRGVCVPNYDMHSDL